MSDKLDDTQKAALSTLLRKPIMRIAIPRVQERTRKGCSTIEEAALNQAYNQGREDAMNDLFKLADIQQEVDVKPRQLKTLGIRR
jgi:predicted ABC-type ATPase